MQGRIYVEPSVIVRDGGGEILVVDAANGAEARGTGRVADELRSFFETGARGPILSTLDDAHPMGRLVASVDQRPWIPLDRRHAIELDGFHTLFLEVTGRCNERCLHCYADASPDVESSLSRATCERVLEEARALGFDHVQFTGGDPLLCDFLPELLAHATAVGFGSREIYTNGLALSDALLERLLPSSPQFAFSFYSHVPETHDRITRVSGSQARTLRAIERVVRSGLPLRVSVLLMDENANDGQATYDLLRAHGVELVRVGGTVAVGRGHVFEPLGELLEQGAGEHRPRGASLPEGKICVTSEGSVVPCIFARDDRLGDVHERSLREILHDPARRPRTLTIVDQERELSCPSCRLTRFALSE